METNGGEWSTYINKLNENFDNKNIYHGHISKVFLRFDRSITGLQISWDAVRYRLIEYVAVQAQNLSQAFA